MQAGINRRNMLKSRNLSLPYLLSKEVLNRVVRTEAWALNKIKSTSTRKQKIILVLLFRQHLAAFRSTLPSSFLLLLPPGTAVNEATLKFFVFGYVTETSVVRSLPEKRETPGICV